MRAVKARPPRRAPNGLALLVLAGMLSAAVVGVGALRGPQRLDAARDVRPDRVVVNLSAQDQQRLDGWDEFFACHGLVSDLVMLATIRFNGDWKPDRPIQLELAPSADLPPATLKELEILNAVTALTTGPAEDRDRACAARAETPAPVAPEARL